MNRICLHSYAFLHGRDGKVDARIAPFGDLLGGNRLDMRVGVQVVRDSAVMAIDGHFADFCHLNRHRVPHGMVRRRVVLHVVGAKPIRTFHVVLRESTLMPASNMMIVRCVR